MPSNWLYIDTNFPSFTQRESADEKIGTMQDYLFMLVEQLRYTLHNLDMKNMNTAAADAFVKTIMDPVYAEIRDAEGNITKLAATAEGLAAQVSDAEGNITQLQLTAQGLQTKVQSLDGSVTNLTADVNGLRATVSGKIDGSKAQTLINQTISGITLAATSDDSGTVFKLSSGGVQVASTGSVDLHVKSVNIDGDVTAAALIGDTVAIKYRYLTDYLQIIEGIAGYITTNATTTGGGLGIASEAGLRLTAGSGSNAFLACNAGNGGPFITLDYANSNVQLGGGQLVLSDAHMFGPSPPTYAPYGAMFIIV